MQNPHLASPISIAPMVGWTNPHFRTLMQLIAPNALLYTEMQATETAINNPKRAYAISKLENYVALQLGGVDPKSLALCTKEAEIKGFSEVNLNLGCPSPRVQAGNFGACLMKKSGLVATAVASMKNATKLPISAKIRIGVDEHDDYAFFSDFVHTLIAAGCDKIIIHARKAWLRGLNPKQNRTIPPLKYEDVYKLKQEIGALPIIINGNIRNIDNINTHLKYVNGVMIGRLAFENPYELSFIHNKIYPDIKLLSRTQIIAKYLEYIKIEFKNNNIRLSILLKPLYNMAHNLKSAKLWRREVMSLQQQGNLENTSRLVDMMEFILHS